MIFQPIEMPEIQREAEIEESLVWEQTLIGKIVNRKHRSWSVCLAGEQGRDQTGLPVMTMNQVGLPVEPQLINSDQNDGFSKQGITQGIVWPGMSIGTQIGIARTVKQIRAINEIQWHPTAGQGTGQQSYMVMTEGKFLYRL